MTDPDIAKVRAALADHIAGAYISGNGLQVARAKELETALDDAGLNVEPQVDRIILAQMRMQPFMRGTDGRTHNCPF